MTLFVFRCFVLLEFNLAVRVAVHSSIIQSSHSTLEITTKILRSLPIYELFSQLFSVHSHREYISFEPDVLLTFSIFPGGQSFLENLKLHTEFLFLTYLKVGSWLWVGSTTCRLVKKIAEHVEEEKYG